MHTVNTGAFELLQDTPPRVFHMGEVSSVLDVVRDPSLCPHLEVFDSLLCKSQTQGRGQYRRQWHSPGGNVYAALRLPMQPPFTGTEAAVALGAALCEALREEGWPCLLKWPNDLVLPDSNGAAPAKVGGILLEERQGVLFAGIGINVTACPEDGCLREDHALAATSLARHAERSGSALPTPEVLWTRLANRLHAFLAREDAPKSWLDRVNRLLLWRDRQIVLEDGEARCAGVLRGVGPAGELLLEESGRCHGHLSGSIRIV